MALENLIPNISGCIENSCGQLTIKDITGVYHVTENPGGWEAIETIEAANVTALTLIITLPDGTINDPVDILSQLPDPVTGEFTFTSLDIPSADGEYSILYTINVGELTKQVILTIYSLCNVRCCVDKMWANYAKELISGTDCGCVDSKTNTHDKAKLAESLLKALTSSTICNSTNLRNSLLEKLQKICKLEDCNCNK